MSGADTGVERLSAWESRAPEASVIDSAIRSPRCVRSSGSTALIPRGRSRSQPVLPGLDAEGFHALEVRRVNVRIHRDARIGFLLCARDLPTTSSRPRAATRDWQPAVLRSRGLDAETYAALRPRVLEAASEPLTPIDLRRALGVGADDDRAYFTMRLMAREGSILRVGTGRVRSDDLRWVPRKRGSDAHSEIAIPTALARLAAAYLNAYGPARMLAFAWWEGVAPPRE